MRYRVVSRLSSAVKPAWLGSLTRTDLIIPYYHVVSDVENVYVKHLYPYKSVAQFRDDLDFLLRHYHPTTLADVLADAKGGHRVPPNSFLLTFDDGFREVFDVIAPILLEKGVSATFFVNSDFVDNRNLCYLNKASLLAEALGENGRSPVERQVSAMLRAGGIQRPTARDGVLAVPYRDRALLDDIAGVLCIDVAERLRRDQPYLTSDQITTLLGMGFTIGGHSIDHPTYSMLSLEEQLRETIVSVEFVRRRFGLDYGVFAFPHHDNRVSKTFFSRLFETGIVDLSFGTAGLLYDSAPNHLQRVSLEAPLDAAARILGFQHARKLAKIVAGVSTIARNEDENEK
jgi:peptidoglycan/xylan/chitin deacetylase (PgdA/CDA1 family)